MKRLDRMSKGELLALKQEIEARLRELEEAEAQRTAQTPFARSDGGPGEARAKGHVEVKTIKGHDYAYLRTWDGKHLRSKYLGKASEVLGQGVRE